MWLVLIRHMWPSHWSLRLVTTDLSSLWGVKNQIKPSSQNQQRNKDWRDKSFILSNCFILIRNLEPLGTCRHGENMWNFAQTVIGAHDWTRSMIIYINSSKFSYMQRVVCLFKQKPLQVKLSKLWLFFFSFCFSSLQSAFQTSRKQKPSFTGTASCPFKWAIEARHFWEMKTSIGMSVSLPVIISSLCSSCLTVEWTSTHTQTGVSVLVKTIKKTHIDPSAH